MSLVNTTSYPEIISVLPWMNVNIIILLQYFVLVFLALSYHGIFLVFYNCILMFYVFTCGGAKKLFVLLILAVFILLITRLTVCAISELIVMLSLPQPPV